MNAFAARVRSVWGRSWVPMLAVCLPLAATRSFGSETIVEDFAGQDFKSKLFRALTNQSGGRREPIRCQESFVG